MTPGMLAVLVLWAGTFMVAAYRGDGFWMTINAAGFAYYAITAWNEWKGQP